MTPAQWVEERATEWAEWLEKTEDGGRGYRGDAVLREYMGRSELSSQSIDYVIFDDARCSEFNSEVNALPAHLGVVFRMHWLGSAAKQISCAANVDMKAMYCGVSRRTYYRHLDEANNALYRSFH